MENPTITCPNCSTQIKLNETLAGPLIAATKKDYEEMLAESQRQSVDELNNLKNRLENQFESERKKLAIDEEIRARNKIKDEFKAKEREAIELKELLQQREVKLAEAQNAQVEFLKQKRGLDDQRRELELTIEKRVQDSIADIQKKATAEAEDGLKLKVLEKEQQISAMNKQIEELKRRSEQGSQQMQGEVLELELEQLLIEKFPFDDVAPVPKGELGADVLQTVNGQNNSPSGKLIWEMKRTKNWSDGWLPKLREDQRMSGADIAVLVSQALPKDIGSFNVVDGIWVTAPRYAIPLAIALRQSLIEISNARHSNDGQETKMELVYQYLTGPRFRHRIEAIVEKFGDMRDDLDRERKAMTRLWAKRESQIEGVISATVGLHGDLQGIAGKAIQGIESLELSLLELDDSNKEGRDK